MNLVYNTKNIITIILSRIDEFVFNVFFNIDIALLHISVLLICLMDCFCCCAETVDINETEINKKTIAIVMSIFFISFTSINKIKKRKRGDYLWG